MTTPDDVAGAVKRLYFAPIELGGIARCKAADIRVVIDELERLRKAKRSGDAASLIVAEIARTIPLGETLARTQNTGEFITYIKDKFDALQFAEAAVGKLRTALKRCASQAGMPDAQEACRTIIATVDAALEENREPAAHPVPAKAKGDRNE